jgi:ABC-type sugar transport system, periplasmic component
MSRIGKLFIAVLVIALLAGALSVTGLAAPQKVTFWAFAANNIEEWKARKADLDKKFNIDLQIVSVPEQGFVQKLQAAMMDGKGYPDIIEWRVELNQILNADPKKAFVIPLDKYVTKSEIYKQVIPGRAGWEVYGGHVYGLPHDINAVVFIYNDTLWKSVGVDMATIETWEEFFEAAQKLTAEKKDGKPLHYALPTQSGGLSDSMWMIWQQTGTQVLDKSGKPIFENADFKSFVNQWVKWYNTGSFVAWDWGGFPNLLASGTLASYCSPDWWVSQCFTAASQGKYQFKVRTLPLYKKGGTKGSAWGGTFLAIDKLAKNQDQLYKLIEYMQYDELGITKYRYPITQILPPIANQLNNAAFTTPDPHFGGQKLGEYLIQSAKELPVINTGDVFWDAVNTDFGSIYPNMQSGKISVDEGLKQVQALALKRLK